MMTAKTAWVQTLKYLRHSWRQVLNTHLIFTALGVIVFSPLVGFTGQLLVELSGQTALADLDIVYFLLSPPGLIALIVFSALTTGILAFEQATMMLLAKNMMDGRRMDTIEALLFVAVRSHKLLLFTVRLVARVLLLTLPFLAVVAGIAILFITDYDINYYLAERPAPFWIAAILMVVVLAAMVLLLVQKLIGWLLALPMELFGGISATQSFSESVLAARGIRCLIFGMLASWTGIMVLLGTALLGVIRLLGSWAIQGMGESISLLVVLLGGLSMLWMLGNFLVTTFASSSFACLVMAVYRQYGPAYNQVWKRSRWQLDGKASFGFTNRNIAVVLIAGVLMAVLTGSWLINDIEFENEVTIIAHRGAAGKTPENTLTAFQQAIEDGTDWIELDVQETADGEVVVIHDSDFMKLAGNKLKVKDATLEQMRNIDIGSWFDPSFSIDRVPTLTEALEAARGKVNVVIELKYYGHDKMLEQRVVDIVEDAGMENEIAIMSLNHGGIRKIRALRPDWNIGLLSARAIGNITRLDVDFLAVATGMATSVFVRRAHQAGKQVFVWTVNSPMVMSRMLSMGVDGIITDEPEKARYMLTERSEMNSVERLLIYTAILFEQPFTPRRYRDNSP